MEHEATNPRGRNVTVRQRSVGFGLSMFLYLSYDSWLHGYGLADHVGVRVAVSMLGGFAFGGVSWAISRYRASPGRSR